MNADALSDREAEEHTRLLRKASRTRLTILGIFAVLTWGLWAMLQAGDQRASAISDPFNKRLLDLRKKWDIPDRLIIAYSMDCTDLLNELAYLKLTTDPTTTFGFCNELSPLRDEYFAALEPAYIVHVKMPYLQDPIEINGLSIADWWPFGLIAVVASAIVLKWREWVNAVIVAWISFNRNETSDRKDLVIHSDFLVGTLTKSSVNRHDMVYRKRWMIQPESLLVYTLIGITIYLSFSFGFFQNPANSYEMESVLFDYVAGIWFFLVLLGCLVWSTRKHYADSLLQHTGFAIHGVLTERFESVARFLKRKIRWILTRRKWMLRVSSLYETLFAIAALICLYFPWMSPNQIRGYRFFLPDAPNNMDSDLYLELQIQLYVAISFVILSLIASFVRAHRPGLGVRILRRLRRYTGILTIALLGNLVFHFLMLQMLAMEEAEHSLLILPWNPIARPHPVKNSILIWMDPAYGFWLFLILCLLLMKIKKGHRTIELREGD